MLQFPWVEIPRVAGLFTVCPFRAAISLHMPRFVRPLVIREYSWPRERSTDDLLSSRTQSTRKPVKKSPILASAEAWCGSRINLG